jgi:hypothetical protein
VWRAVAQPSGTAAPEIIARIGDLPTNQSADDRGADRALKDKSADE